MNDTLVALFGWLSAAYRTQLGMVLEKDEIQRRSQT